MTGNHFIVEVFKSHLEAETAVKELPQTSADTNKLSIVHRGLGLMPWEFRDLRVQIAFWGKKHDESDL